MARMSKSEVLTAVSEMLEEAFPDATPEQRMREHSLLTLELICMGRVVAIIKVDGDVMYKHVEHCSDGELAAAMSPEAYAKRMGIEDELS